MSSSQDQGWVALAGAGPGDEGLLTVRAAELLSQADLVVADADLAPAARRHMSPETSLSDPADGGARTLVQAAKDGQFAVRLYRGDPLLNGAVADAATSPAGETRTALTPLVPTSRPRKCSPAAAEAGTASAPRAALPS